jgi:hypothetical protein
MQRATNKEKADQLLTEWHLWASSWRPDLGVPGCAPECRGASSSRQWDSTSEIADDACFKLEMDAVQASFDILDAPYKNAIAMEMRNRVSDTKLWVPVMGKTYDEALDAIIPIMNKNGLFS